MKFQPLIIHILCRTVTFRGYLRGNFPFPVPIRAGYDGQGIDKDMPLSQLPKHLNLKFYQTGLLRPKFIFISLLGSFYLSVQMRGFRLYRSELDEVIM
jgi:hypothetical protein